jgi:hypothetical protein
LATAPAADPIPQSLLDMFKARMQRQNEKRKASTAGNSPRQAQSTPLVKTPSLSKSEQVRQAEITKQQLRIDRAQQCLETLKNPAATVQKPRTKESARSLEKKIAALTKDKDLLKHGSDKIKSEALNDIATRLLNSGTSLTNVFSKIIAIIIKRTSTIFSTTIAKKEKPKLILLEYEIK